MPDDVFFSYRTHTSAEAAPLLEALEAEGLSIWRDQPRVAHSSSISDAVRQGLSNAKLLVAFYGKTYAHSRICMWELASAWAAGLAEGDPYRRVLVVLPPSAHDRGHILLEPPPGREADQLWRLCPPADDPAGLASLARDIAAHVADLEPTLGQLAAVEQRARCWPRTPPYATSFVGRARELWTLHGRLHRSEAVAVTGSAHVDQVQVRGLGGIGKTLLAAEYALRFESAYPGGIFWVQGRSQPDQVLYDLAPEVQVPRDGMAYDDVVAAVRRSFDERPRYLWIVDDLAADLTGDEVRSRSAPGGLGHTLFTTRSKRWRALGEVLDLQELQPDEALRLLTADREPTTTEEAEAAARIVGQVGHHPLAVDVLRRLVTDHPSPTPFGDWTHRLASPGAEALETAADLARDEELPTGIATSISEVLRESLDRVEDEGRDLLFTATCLAEAPIPGTLAVGMVVAVDRCDEVTAQDRVARGLRQLSAVSLVEGDGAAFEVHAIVRRVVRSRWGEEKRREGFEQCCVPAVRAALGDVEDVREHAKAGLVVAHAVSLATRRDDLAGAQLASDLGIFDEARGAYRRALEWAESAHQRCRDILGPEHPDALGTLQNLASILHALGDLQDARQHLEKALEAWTRTLGPEHPHTLGTLQNLASILHALGDLQGARQRDEQVLEARTRILGPEHPHTLSTLQNLAGTLYALGDFEGARQREEQALEARTRILGPEHPHTLSTLQNLAGTLKALGDVQGARLRFEKALDASIRILGPEHPDTLTTLHNLASTLYVLGDLQGARQRGEHALEAWTRILGPEHPHTLTAMQTLASPLKALGDLQGARQLEERALEASTRTLGHEHPATLTVLQNLAHTLHALGDLQGARHRYEKALEARTRILGPEHPDTLGTLQNLANTLNSLGDLQGARQRLESALEARTRILGPEHPDTLSTEQSLAGILLALGDAQGAKQRVEKALEARTRILGPEHPDTLGALQNLAGILHALGDLPGARQRFEKALAGMTRVLGPEHPHTLSTAQNLAGTLLALRDLQGARQHLKKALAGMTRALGPEHPHTLGTLQNFARTLKALGDLQGARQLEEQALEARTRVLGVMHPDVSSGRFNLVLTLLEQEPQAAIPHLNVLARLREKPQKLLSAHERQILEALPDLEARAGLT